MPMPKKTKSISGLKKLFAQTIKMLEEQNDKDITKYFAESYHKMLDDLLGQDFFGTEGQGDPRGDHRDWE
jgi:hypothetical protein